MGQCNIYPNGPGALTEGMPAYPPEMTLWGAVTDGSDESYVMAVIAGRQLTYLHTPHTIPAGAGNIRLFVSVRCRRAEEVSVGESFTPMIYLQGTTVNGTIQNALLTWSNYEEEFFRPTGGAWTAQDISDVQIGVLLYGYDNHILCSEISARLTWTDPVAPPASKPRTVML